MDHPIVRSSNHTLPGFGAENVLLPSSGSGVQLAGQTLDDLLRMLTSSPSTETQTASSPKSMRTGPQVRSDDAIPDDESDDDDDDDDDDDCDDDDCREPDDDDDQDCLIGCQADYANCLTNAGCGETFQDDLSVCAANSLSAQAVALTTYTLQMANCAKSGYLFGAICALRATIVYDQQVNAAAAGYDSCKSTAAGKYSDCFFGDCFSALADCMKGC
jgi:hypothetical protein